MSSTPPDPTASTPDEAPSGVGARTQAAPRPGEMKDALEGEPDGPNVGPSVWEKDAAEGSSPRTGLTRDRVQESQPGSDVGAGPTHHE